VAIVVAITEAVLFLIKSSGPITTGKKRVRKAEPMELEELSTEVVKASAQDEDDTKSLRQRRL